MGLRRVRRAIWMFAWVTLLAYGAAILAALPHHTLYAAARSSNAITWMLISVGCQILDGIVAWRTHTTLPGGFLQASIYGTILILILQGSYALQFLTTGDWGSCLLYAGIALVLIYSVLSGNARYFKGLPFMRQRIR